MEKMDKFEKVIKCPNYHTGGILNKRSCFFRHSFHERTSCRISGQYGKPPCEHGLIDKKKYERLAYPKQASWLPSASKKED